MNAAATPGSPFGILVRHFFSSFFRLSFLDDAGEESFKRGLIGVLSAVIALGLLLVRIYVGRYAGIADPELVARMLTADRLFVLALPMFTITLVMALVSHSIFPDELDFRTLMALPLTRRTVFAAKFAALGLFTALFTAGVSLGVVLPLSLLISGADRTLSPMRSVLATLGLGVWGCALAVMFVVALEGVISVAVPRLWMRRASVWLQSTLVGALVLTVPLIARIPGAGATLAERPPWLFVVPPVWLLGVEEWLLGRDSVRTGSFALVGLGVTALLAVISVVTVLMTYRRFDHAVFRPGSPRPPWRWNRAVRWSGAPPASAAVRDFVAATLRRSGLHQLAFASVVAVGCALAVNAVLGAMSLSQRWWIRAALGTPFTLMAASMVGLRIALLLPTNVRAGWIFRFTETSAQRRHQLDAVRRAMFVSGVVGPVAAALPLIAAVLGVWPAVTLAPLIVMIGWACSEGLCLDWRRIPFTCTFLFAKRPPAYTLFLLIMIFGWFVFIGTSLLDTARRGVVPWMVVAALIAMVGLSLRWYRLQNWGQWPLEFEDYLPDGFDTLKLGGWRIPSLVSGLRSQVSGLRSQVLGLRS